MSTHQKTAGMKAPSLILASSSPRRVALLREHGYPVDIVEPPISEPRQQPRGLLAAQLAEALAFLKASSVRHLVDHGLILGGDTVVALGSRIIGKPEDRADGRRIITALAGTTHDVITGLALIDARSGDRLIRHDRTTVTMRSMTPEEIENYLDTGGWVGKAGAYGIQDHGDVFVERIEGSFTNVVGLPIELLSAMLSIWETSAHQANDDRRGCEPS